MRRGIDEGLPNGCNCPFDVFGTSLKAPEVGHIVIWESNQRYALSILVKDIPTEQISASPGISISNVTIPIIGTETEIEIPDIDEMENDEQIVVYQPMISAAKVPSSYPYRGGCARNPPTSSADERTCERFKVELVPGYRIVINRRQPGETPFLTVTIDGYHQVVQSRAIRVDGKQTLVTYVIRPGTADFISDWRHPLGNAPWSHPYEVTEPTAYSFHHGTHFQVDVKSGGVAKKISVARFKNYGEEDWDQTIEALEPYEFAFWQSYDLVPTVSGDVFNLDVDNVHSGIIPPSCHCVYLGKDYYLVSSYDPSKSLTFSGSWRVGRLKYEGYDPNGRLEGYGCSDVSNAGCEGDWKIVLPSCRAYLLTDPPGPKDLSEWGLTPPTLRLPDEPWVTAIHSSNSRLVTARALNKILRTNEEWDGTIDESEIENVIVWDTLPLDGDVLDITEIKVRAYQHINGKDYVIFTTPGPPRYVDFTASFESNKPAEIYHDPDAGIDKVRKPGIPDLNFNMPAGIEFISVGRGQVGAHYWELEAPLRFGILPQWPYTQSDKDLYELCLFDGEGNQVGETCNLTDLTFLRNYWAGPPNPTFNATLKLYVGLGADATISFRWRFDNRTPGSTPPFTPTTNIPDTNSWLEFRVNGEVAVGKWNISDTEEFPFHIDHADESFTPPTYEDYRVFTMTITDPGAYTLEWVVHNENVTLEGRYIGDAFLDQIHITKVQLPDDEDNQLRWYYDGEQVREVKHVTWVYRDQTDPPPPEGERTKRVPDFITVDDVSDISGGPKKILYGNPHYVARVFQNGSLDTDFHNDPELRAQGQSNPEFGGVKKGFVRFSPTPSQPAQALVCDDTTENWTVVGDTKADPPWGAMQILPTKQGRIIQLRGINSSFRDASDVGLLPMRIDHGLDPFVFDESTSPPTKYETHGLLSFPDWEDYRWLPLLRVLSQGNGWPIRATGWTIGKDGRNLIPHLEIIWAPYFDSPSWPTTDWPDPPYPDPSIWYWNRPRDPRNLPPWEAIEGENPNDRFVPVHYSQYNCLVSRAYTDAWSHYPQFAWATSHPDDPLGSPYWPWELVMAYQSPASGHGSVNPLWYIFQQTLLWLDENKCDPESGETRRTSIIRPNSFQGSQPFYFGAAWTDFDAVDCDCCGS